MVVGSRRTILHRVAGAAHRHLQVLQEEGPVDPDWIRNPFLRFFDRQRLPQHQVCVLLPTLSILADGRRRHPRILELADPKLNDQQRLVDCGFGSHSDRLLRHGRRVFLPRVLGLAADLRRGPDHPGQTRILHQQTHFLEQTLRLDRENQLLALPLALAIVGVLEGFLPERKHISLRQHFFHYFLDGCGFASELLHSGGPNQENEGKEDRGGASGTDGSNRNNFNSNEKFRLNKNLIF